SWRALVDGIAQTGHHVTDIRYAAVTHLHPDHFGLAPRLREVSGAALAMHGADAALLGHRSAADTTADEHTWNTQLNQLGAPTGILAAARVDLVRLGPGESMDVVLGDNTPLGLPGWDLRAVWTPGHTPGHLTFVDDTHGLMFSGDHMLPRISPNISTVPGELENPLHRYLLSLHATTTMPDGEVLPAHEYRFRGIADRARQLMGHHEERFTEIVAALAVWPESTAWEISQHISWSRPFDSMSDRLLRLAVRETHAHLLVLADRGSIRSLGGRPERWTPTSRKEDTP
ncbi:MBL fold metallo-hydrolase, partial [Streptomyces sp. NPDC058171]